MSEGGEKGATTGATAQGGERLQKLLARAGLGSRRACEELIRQGRVTVDGQLVTELGYRVDPDRQVVKVDGERIEPEKLVYYLVNKPRGVVCTNRDPAGRPRVLDLLERVPQRVFCVGRLDLESEGLILVTNDGELAQRLMHPRYGVPKTYVVQVAGLPSAETLARIRRGVWLVEGKVKPDRLRKLGSHGKSTLLEIVLSEGRNRVVRRIFARMGHKVMRLRRTAIGPIRDAKLKPGQYRRLTPAELAKLKQIAYAGRADGQTSRHGGPRAKGKKGKSGAK